MATSQTVTSRPLSPWLALAPLPAIAAGALVASRTGVSPLAFAPNAAAVLVGWGLLPLVAGHPWRQATAARLAPWLALVAVAATFLAPGLDGVHRWLAVGPVRLLASAAFAPWLLLGFASPERTVRERTTFAALGVQLLHLAQPDAAQATAVALGLAPVLTNRRFVRAGLGIPALLLLGGAAALTWLRLDHLPPVPHVEQILALAHDQGTLTFLGALLALGLALLPLARPLRGGEPPARALASGASLYLCGAVAATFAGSFPVPLVGAGAGPVLGWFGLALPLVGAPRPLTAPERGAP